jgi:hypothetical protein
MFPVAVKRMVNCVWATYGRVCGFCVTKLNTLRVPTNKTTANNESTSGITLMFPELIHMWLGQNLYSKHYPMQ